MTAVQTAAGQVQYLTFQLAGEEFAFGILRVKEILEYDTITRVPNAPVTVRGVINLRGSVVPVVDLGLLFGLPATVAARRSLNSRAPRTCRKRSAAPDRVAGSRIRVNE